MRKKIYKPVMAVIPTLLLLLFLLPACSDESGTGTPDIPETKYAKLTITLGSLDSAEPSYTKAVDGNGIADNDVILDPDSADTPYERHIDDWWIVIVKNDGTVEKVLSNTKAHVSTSTEDNDNTHQIGVDLVVGESYKFYAFANLTHLENSNKVTTTLNALENQQFSTFRKTATSLKDISNYNGGSSTSYIPMSSYMGSKTVSEVEAENQVSLSLIRLLGKVQIDVTNATGVNITVKKLSMGKFRRSGDIYLLPYDAVENDPGKPNLWVKDNREDKLQNPTFPADETVSSRDWDFEPNDQIVTEKEASYSFYINETDQANVDPDGGDMKIALEVEGQGIEKDKTPKPTNFFFIRRNDLLKIPVLISNADTKIEFKQQHMPIGGLPAQFQFTSGVDVSSRTFVTDHAGDITISYSLEKMSGVDLTTGDQTWRLKYYQPETTVTKGEHFCYAELIDNTPVESTGTNFLLEPATQDDLGWWTPAGNEEADKPTCAFPLTKAKVQESNMDSPTEGSFTITLQELTKDAHATIRLNLVTVNQEGTEVVLPYTLIVTNKTQKGGN